MERYCPYCGTLVREDQAGPGSLPETMTCPTCNQEMDRPSSAAPPFPPPDQPTLAQQLGREPEEPAQPDPQAPVWEAEGGLVGRLWRTTWQVLMHPMLTLGAPARPGLGWPLGYALILGTLAAALNALWSRLVGFPGPASSGDLASLVAAPVQVAVSLFVGAAVLHFCLWVLRGTSAGYTGTFRVLAYAQAAGIWSLVPWLGLPLGVIWSLVVMIAGLAAAHRTSRWRAFWALFFPVVLVGFLLALLALAFGLGALLGIAQKARVFAI